MVHRKLPRKKPRHPIDVSKNGLPAEDHVRRGGPMALAAALPSYMRATSSSGAKAGGGEVASAPPPDREVVGAKVVLGRAPYVSRATCSSAMKGAAAAAGPAAGRVCPYAFCSLKGHAHAAVAPLGSFVASRRRLIKTGQSMKQKGVSPFRKTSNGGGGDGFFVEIYTGSGAATVSSGVSCSDLSTEEMDAVVGRMEYVTFDRQGCRDAEDKVTDPDVSVDDSCGSSDVILGWFAELSGTTKFRGHLKEEIDEEEEASSVNQEAEDFGDSKSDISEELYVEDEGNISEGEISVSEIVCFDAVDDPHIETHKQLFMADEPNNVAILQIAGGDASKKSSIDDMSNAFGRMIFKDENSDPIDATTCKRSKLIVSRRGTPKEGKRILTFNPRAPNFLPVEPDPDAEKVYLRHQMTNDRKNAEEWMVDYAVRRAVRKLARAQKRKVEMLVQAFETVLPPVHSEKKSVQHDDAKKNFTQTGTWQACN